MRQLQMEMIMADHHQDCASCPRNGNCELLAAANSVGLKQIRFRYTEGWENLEPDCGTQPVVYDRSRCIRCQRCVAVCRKVQNVDALELAGWGNNAGVRLKGGSVKLSPCVTCGQCVMAGEVIAPPVAPHLAPGAALRGAHAHRKRPAPPVVGPLDHHFDQMPLAGRQVHFLLHAWIPGGKEVRPAWPAFRSALVHSGQRGKPGTRASYSDATPASCSTQPGTSGSPA